MTGVLLTAAIVTAVAAALRGTWSPCGLSMLTSLNPVAERARGHRFWVTAGWYVTGAAGGGALLGGGCALLACGVRALAPGQSAVWAVVLACAAVGVVSDSGIAGRRLLPEHPRQVDERWLDTYRRWLYAGGYGVQIGTGFATYVMTAAVYLTAVLAVLTGSPARAFAVCLVFGAVRGAVIAVAAPARSPERLRTLLARVDALDRGSLQAAALVQAAVGAAAGWALGGAWVALAAAVVLAATLLLAAGLPVLPLLPARGDHQVHQPHLLQHRGG